MKKINWFLIVCLLLLLACAKKVAKPKITISDYSTQAITSKGLVEKLMNEPDYKKMHEIASAIESSRAVSCVSVSEECNVLGKILNKIVSSTHDGLPKESDSVEIYKMINQLDQELKIGQEKLGIQWAEYIQSQAPTAAK